MSGRRIWVYAGVLILCAVVACPLVMPSWLPKDPVPIAVLAILTFALTNMAVELPFAVSLSLSFAPIFAGVLIAGPFGGALMGLASSVSWQEVRRRTPPEIMLVNMAQLFLAGLGAGLAFVALGGELATRGQLTSIVAPFASLVAVLVFYVLNLVLVGIGLSLKTGMGFRGVLAALSPGSYWASLLVLALLGYVMAYLISVSSWLGVLLLVLPFMAARRTFRVYAELTEAYTSTVRSLVTAIEAKDPYTRGHSERVAVYARRLGEYLGLPRAQVELLERAALLHDVGKIGIELDTLSSPMQLSAEEVRLIRRHPALGSELVSDVEFLADIVPVIRHHHERYDGAGYPDGLAGVDIPLLARLMAVADSYDAMTSNRAYRPAMTEEQALVEIERVAGTQLDRTMALRFAAMLAESREEGTPHEA